MQNAIVSKIKQYRLSRLNITTTQGGGFKDYNKQFAIIQLMK
jgi:hypothetical protein